MNKIRSYDLDNLKVFLTVMVIFHHAGQAYGDGGDWPYHPSNPAEYMPEIWRFFSTNAAYLMGLFFLISGCPTGTECSCLSSSAAVLPCP